MRDRLGLASFGGIAVAALAGYFAVIPGLAHADVTSSDYSIGGGAQVAGVSASPSTVAAVTSTQFKVTFTTDTPLTGSEADSVTITPTAALASTPSNIGITGSSCIQAGTDGGAYSALSIAINLTPGCNLAAGTQVTVLFTAGAPFAVGTFAFDASTSRSGPARSNAVTVTPSGPQLSAKSQTPGAETTYAIDGVPIANLTADGISLTLTAAATQGSETINFLNSGSGGAGYTVTYTPPGGAATSDAVTNASASGATTTLTLASGLVSGDTVDVTAAGQNPAPSANPQANDIAVQPGNGTPYKTNSINFGSSVTAVSVIPSLPVAMATTTYAVNFTASDATSSGGDIYLSESDGPTNFETVGGIAVTDNTQHWEFIATGAILSNGAATIPLQDAINAGDSLTVTLAGVTNPGAIGTINDFAVSTSADPVAVSASPYSITANGTPGVAVTVDPSSLGASATYTLSNILAAADLAGGSATIKLEAPAGTVFPSSPSDYGITDDTTPSGSGTVTAALSGAGTNVVTFTLPNSIKQGDELTLKIAEVLNPTLPSSTDAITLVGAVTNLPPTALTPSTTPSYSLGVSLAGAGGGSVSGSGIACPSTCSARYQAGTTVTLNATPAAGSTFLGWSGACTGTGPCQLKMNSDQAVTATFATKLSCTLTPLSGVVSASAHDAAATKLKKQAAGVLELTARCDQAAGLQLAGKISADLKAKSSQPRAGKGRHPKTKTFQIKAVRASIAAGKSLTLSVKLPKAALTTLENQLSESATFTLTATDPSGTSTTTAEIKRLKLVEGRGGK